MYYSSLDSAHQYLEVSAGPSNQFHPSSRIAHRSDPGCSLLANAWTGRNYPGRLEEKTQLNKIWLVGLVVESPLGKICKSFGMIVLNMWKQWSKIQTTNQKYQEWNYKQVAVKWMIHQWVVVGYSGQITVVLIRVASRLRSRKPATKIHSIWLWLKRYRSFRSDPAMDPGYPDWGLTLVWTSNLRVAHMYKNNQKHT